VLTTLSTLVGSFVGSSKRSSGLSLACVAMLLLLPSLSRAALTPRASDFVCRPETSSHKPVSVVLVGHGLNNPPALMMEMARDLCRAGHIAILLELKGHDPAHPDHDIRTVKPEDWLRDMERDLGRAQSLAAQNHVPLDVVAYSLSDLVFETYMSLHPQTFKVRRIVSLAPAIGVKAYTHLVRYLPLSGKTLLPSKNRPDSRANWGTSLAAYRALFSLRDTLLKKHFKGTREQPHLVILSRGDELVDSSRTLDFIRKESLGKKWLVLELSKSDEGRKHSFHHLMVNRASLGAQVYEKMIGEIDRFLELSAGSVFEARELKTLSPAPQQKLVL
jgi:esterase/lipase